MIALSETRLDSSIGDAEIIQDFTLFRKDRIGRAGGGVLLGVSNSLNAKVENVFLDSSSELVSFSLTMPHQPKLSVACYYRPPSAAGFSDLEEWLDMVSGDVVIVGDFNVPGIDWDKFPTATYGRGSRKDLTDILRINSLAQIVKFPTHVHGNVLDLIAHNLEVDAQILGVETGLSDHSAIVAGFPMPTPIKKSETERKKTLFDFSIADEEIILKEMRTLSKEVSLLCENGQCTTEDIWITFKSKFLFLLNSYVPKFRPKNYKQRWLSTKTIREIRKKRRLFNVSKNYPSFLASHRVKEQNQLCRKLIDSDYKEHLNRRICDQLKLGNTKPLFKFIDSKKTTNSPIVSFCMLSKEDNSEVASTFLKSFSETFVKDNGNRPEVRPVSTESRPMDLCTINENGVHTLFNNIDPRKSAGPDDLTSAAIKHFSKVVSPILTCIMQHSLNTGVVPADWRAAKVIPIYKKGDKSDPKNYRPISITSLVSKTFEHILSHAIMDHLEVNNLLTEVQHGFRKRHSCESQLLITADDLVNNFDVGVQTDVIVLDFAKAFDSVSFQKLHLKLFTFGIHPTIINWIRAWLSNRTYFVAVADHFSELGEVGSGVPQGSVLGPLLFLLYINDLPTVVKFSKVKLFADDVLLYHPIRSQCDSEELQEDLNAVVGWADTWQMSLNLSKCETCSVTRAEKRKQETKYVLGSNPRPIKSVNEFIYLGVTFTNKLSFNTHISNIAAKGLRTLSMLRRTLRGASRETKTLSYFTICRPILEYASTVWAPERKFLQNSIERIQRKAFRWVYQLGFKEQISEKMIAAGWEPLSQRRRTIDINTYHKIMSGDLAIDYSHHLKFNNVYNTRGGLIRAQASTDVRKHSFFNRIIGEISG